MQHKRGSDSQCSGPRCMPQCLLHASEDEQLQCSNACQTEVAPHRHSLRPAPDLLHKHNFDVLAQKEVKAFYVSRSKLTLWSRCQPPCYVSEVSGIMYVNCRDASRSDYEQQDTDVASSQIEAGPQTSEAAVFEFGRYVSSTRLNIVHLHASLIDGISDSFMLGDQKAVCNVGELQTVW